MTMMSNTAQIVEDSIVKTIHYDKLKYKTLAKVAQDKSKKLNTTVEEVKGWITDFKKDINFEGTHSEA